MYLGAWTPQEDAGRTSYRATEGRSGLARPLGPLGPGSEENVPTALHLAEVLGQLPVDVDQGATLGSAERQLRVARVLERSAAEIARRRLALAG